MRICLVYDCIFPWTIGGAERWYRNLAVRLAAQGHDITYLTLTQWNMESPPSIPGVKVVSVGPQMPLYHRGRRAVIPPLRFGVGVFLHLMRKRYDVVHTASFPFFSMLAIGALRPLYRFGVVCDWHEVWSRRYWREYLGRWGGFIGWQIQRLCMKIPQRAYAFSMLHTQRLRSLRVNGIVTTLTGEYEGASENPAPVAASHPPRVVYAGRLIPEKRVALLVQSVGVLRQHIPDLRATIFGDGPESTSLRTLISSLGLEEVIDLAGFAPAKEVSQAMARAVCVVQPSSREGYGMVVVEASALGTPAVVIDGEDNAAVELIAPGRNGFVAPHADAESLSAQIVRCWREGDVLRASTRDWYKHHAERLSLDHSLRQVVNGYANG